MVYMLLSDLGGLLMNEGFQFMPGEYFLCAGATSQ